MPRRYQWAASDFVHDRYLNHGVVGSSTFRTSSHFSLAHSDISFRYQSTTASNGSAIAAIIRMYSTILAPCSSLYSERATAAADFKVSFIVFLAWIHA